MKVLNPITKHVSLELKQHLAGPPVLLSQLMAILSRSGAIGSRLTVSSMPAKRTLSSPLKAIGLWRGGRIRS